MSISIDELLDAQLDDLADLPEFKTYPVGSHRCTLKFEIKEIGDAKIPSIELNLVAVETVQLANETEDAPLAAGDKTSVLYMLKKKDGTPNEIAQGQFKEVMKYLAATYGALSNRDLMAAADGSEALVTTKLRADKRDKDNIKYYTDIVMLQIL